LARSFETNSGSRFADSSDTVSAADSEDRPGRVGCGAPVLAFLCKATTTLGRTRTTFTKGDGRNKGRPLGSHNKLTRSAREAIEYCALQLGGGQRLYRWCKESKTNERTFWSSIYPRLLPITGHFSAVFAPEPSPDAEAAVAEMVARLDAIAEARNIATSPERSEELTVYPQKWLGEAFRR
jgi:hypothetical protein